MMLGMEINRDKILADLRSNIKPLDLTNDTKIAYQIGRNSLASQIYIAVCSGEYDKKE